MAEKNKTPNGFSLNIGDGYSGIFGKDILTPVGRIAFVNLVTPTGKPTPKYGLSLLVDKKDETAKSELKAIQEMCKLMVVDFWGDRAGEMIKKIKRPIFGDGDSPSSTGKMYEGYAGNFVLNARNQHPPEHPRGFKIAGNNIMREQFQSGMLCRLNVSPYLNADGFSYTLRAIKLIKDDGVRFGGAPDPTGLLDAVDDAAGAVNSTDNIDLNAIL